MGASGAVGRSEAPKAPRFGGRVARPGGVEPSGKKGKEGARRRALGTCPAPCSQATQDTRLRLGMDEGPSAGAGWSGAETPGLVQHKEAGATGPRQRVPLPPSRQPQKQLCGVESWTSDKRAATPETRAPVPPSGDAPPPHTAPYLNRGGSRSSKGRGRPGLSGACACALDGAGPPPATCSPESILL